MTWHTWWLFCITVVILSGTPGPNMLHMLSRSIRFGPKRVVYSMLGSITALVLTLIIAAAGISAFLLATPGLFNAIKYLGIAYLFYLGISAWRGTDAPFTVRTNTRDKTDLALYRDGFLVCASNPKLILFATAFFTQFVHQEAAQLPQFAILISTYACIEMFWYAVYAKGGQKLADILTRPVFRIWFNRMTGGIFVGFGLALLRIR